MTDTICNCDTCMLRRCVDRQATEIERLNTELAECRSKTLEEAAEICGAEAKDSCEPCWEKIRALKKGGAGK